MAEEPSVVYGRLRESVHISGYSASRACDALEWLLEEERWKSVGVGFADGNQFLSTIDLSEFRIDESRRKKLVKKIKEVTEASQRAIGSALGVSLGTVNSDLNVQNRTSATNDVPGNQQDSGDNVQNRTSLLDQSGVEAAELLSRKAKAAEIREERREEIAERIAEVASRPAELVHGDYDVIVIDPPWPMEKIERDVTPNQVNFDYPVMEESELLALEIPAAEDCHVWLWTTHKFLPMAFRLLSAWSLKYVCTFVWHKPGGFQPFGLPQYNCEFVLYARKGSPLFSETKKFPVCFQAPRGEHSEKPEAFYELLRRVTPGRRLDMFNRRQIEGFDGWGKESA